MTFSPKNNKIYVQTYSPYTDSYITDGDSFFELDYDMTIYQNLGSIPAVSSGSSASLSWAGLSPYTKYFWYAYGTDTSSQTGKSTVREFITGNTGNPVEGDINQPQDGIVNLLDLQVVTSRFGLTLADPGWNSIADLTVPYGEIDIFDVVFVASRFT